MFFEQLGCLGVELRPVALLVAMWAVWRGGGGSREMGHEGRCNVHLGGLDGGVGRKLAVSEVRMGERHLCHAIGCSWPAALRPPPSNRLLVTSWGK